MMFVITEADDMAKIVAVDVIVVIIVVVDVRAFVRGVNTNGHSSMVSPFFILGFMKGSRPFEI